jgi:hypothetical protein
MLNVFEGSRVKLLVPIVAILLASVVLAVAFVGLIGAPSTQANEKQNDLQVNIGSSYPGIADMVSVSVAKAGSTLNATITVKSPIIPFTEEETAQFNMVIILENQEDVLQTYELRVDINATGVFGVIQDVQTKSQQHVELLLDGNTLKISADLPELINATQVEWSINSTYEKLSDNQIVASAWDFIPDQGLRTTIF